MKRFTTSEPLYRAVRAIDRNLSRPTRRHADIADIQQALRVLEQFHKHVDQDFTNHAAQDENQNATQAAPESDLPDVRPDALIAAGCRLSVDLNESLSMRLMDSLQAHEQQIEALSQQLKTQLQKREEIKRLLRQAQGLQQKTHQTAEAVGLGLIL